MKILVADDDNGIRLFLAKYLEKRGYEPTPCTSGAEAWKAFEKDYYPLAIFDWNMPGILGPELCERVKLNQKYGFTYVILLTSRSQPGDVVEGLERGADDYLTKPVVGAELDARLKSAFRIIEYEHSAREKERQIRLSCFKTLTDLAEKRDHESNEHTERIGAFSELIARRMGLDEEFCQNIRVFAPMHDIGKVGIPDGILHIPRTLSNPEYEVIKMHTKIGWQILKGKQEFEMAADIAYSHHEYWNGKGYPRHIKADAIPLSGRICAVADCYDSLRTERPYSPARSHDEIIEYLQSEAGERFDPDVIAAAVSVAPELKKLFDSSHSILMRIHP